MHTNGLKVELELHTTIDDDGQLEENTTAQSGLLYQSGNRHVLLFDEGLEDGSIVKNMITIQSDKVSIKRTGPITMHQQFYLNRITENVFQHPHGNLHMETTTTSIDYQPLSAYGNGILKLYYNVKLNGQNERKHTLTLSLKEEAPR